MISGHGDSHALPLGISSTEKKIVWWRRNAVRVCTLTRVLLFVSSVRRQHLRPQLVSGAEIASPEIHDLSVISVLSLINYHIK